MRPDPRDSGQTTIEWLGIAAVVAALVGALLGAAPGIGQTVATAVETVICRVSGGTDCGTPPEEEVCITHIARREATGGVTIISVNPELTVAAETRVRSDGTAQVVVSAEGSLGAEFILGASGEIGSLEVETPNGEIGVGQSGEASLIFEFPDQAAADNFVDDVTTTAIATGVGGPLGGLVAAHLTDLDFPQPSAVQIIGEIGMEGSGSGTTLEGEGSGNVAAGLVHDLDSGHTTFILEGGGSLGAEFQPLAKAAGAEVSSTTQIRLEVDERGNPVAIELRNTLTGEVSGLIAGTAAQSFIGDDSIAGEVATTLIGLEPSGSAQVRTTARVDLQDPALGDAANSLVDAILDGDAAAVSDAAGTLGGEIYDNGEITADVYIGEEDALNIDLGAGEGLAVGVEAGASTSTADLIASLVARPGEGIQRRCAD